MLHGACKPREACSYFLPSYTNFIRFSNDRWTTTVDEAVSQMNETINILSSAVRTLISQRNLTSLKEAIENGKSPYDELRHESDDPIDSLHKNHEEVSETNKNGQNEQYMKPQKGPIKGSEWKAEDSVYSSSGRAPSPEDTLVARPTFPDEDPPRLDARYLTPSYQPYGSAPIYDNRRDRGEDEAWNSHNLLSLGCPTFFTISSYHANRTTWQMVVVSVAIGAF